MLRVIDFLLAPIVFLAALPMKLIRKKSMRELPLVSAVLRRVGVFPITDHYYEPLVDMSGVDLSGRPRDLPGVDLRHDAQVALLGLWDGSDIPDNWEAPAPDDVSYSLQNRNFGAGDADLWWQVIRHLKPSRIVEIGSGHSTRVAREAIARNTAEQPAYSCQHICIEPYEMPWLEKLGIEIRRSKLEDTDSALFDSLGEGDILFIDSSHMIRPGGEVLMEFLQILPRLAKGVTVHVHDIFTPHEYPAKWLKDPRFWNEQYLLEAFLSHNSDWEVMIGGNYCAHHASDALAKACRYFQSGQHEPGSFYIRRVA
ncbi:MAG: class I SAM-dependent methyltransferase [Erythrobacter sp.]